jgi:hypothetical protein
MTRRTAPSEQGFALIVIGALFVAFAMIAATVIDRTNATKQQSMIQRTQVQMSRLSEALLRYSLDNNNRYPCPASPTLAISNTNFGFAITGCEASLGAGIVALTNGAMIRGMVPVTELLTYGADPSDAFDTWGNRIMYVVDRQMTPAGTPGTPAANRPTVADTSTGTTITYRSPDYILISYGRDAIGAIPKNGTAVATACNAGNGEMRMANCDTDLNFTVAPISTGPALTSAQYFDDLLLFYGR